ELYTPLGKKKIEAPRALDLNEIPQVVEQFKKGAENAMAAGFDGVEIHGANGYLLEQFLKDGTNQRIDAYGGSIEKRMRFPLEVVDAVVGGWGPERVGYRFSPYFDHYSMSDSNPVATYNAFIPELNRRKLAYLDVVEGVSGPRKPAPGTTLITPIARQK